MKRSEVLFGLARLPVDAVSAVAALLIAYLLRERNIDLIPSVQLLDPASTLPPLNVYSRTFVFFGALTFLGIAACMGLYALRSTRSAWDEIGRILVAALLWLVAVVGWYFLVQKQLFYSRVLLLHSVVFLAVCASVLRAGLTLLQRRLMRRGIGVRHVVSVGAQGIAKVAKRTLATDCRYKYAGHVSDVQALQELLRSSEIDVVIQTDPAPASSETVALIEFCRSQHIGYAFLPPVLADVPHLLQVDRLGLVPMIRLQPTPLDGWGRIFKRLFDLLCALLLLLLLSPVLLCIALAVLVQDGWPVLYVSRRVGQRGESSVPVLKFRTMVKDADRQKDGLRERNHRADGPLFKVKNDPRVTALGRMLRRWSLDELPQIFNVIAGQVSLVGPRPHLPEEVKRYDVYQRRVFAVKPGITGLAQISGRSDLSFREEVALDLQYIEEWSLLLDLWVLWRTLLVVASRKGAD